MTERLFELPEPPSDLALLTVHGSAPPPEYSLKNAPAAGSKDEKDKPRTVLVVTDLRSLDLEKELAEQYALSKQVFTDIQYDAETPANQKAQLLNTINATLSTIVKAQAEVYSIERMKALEDTLISTLKAFPEMRDAFLTAYETALKELKA